MFISEKLSKQVKTKHMIWLKSVYFIDITCFFVFCFVFCVCALIGGKCCSIGSITLNTGSAGFYHFWTEFQLQPKYQTCFHWIYIPGFISVLENDSYKELK